MLPSGAAEIESLGVGVGTQGLANLAPAVREVYLAAFSASLATVFMAAAGIALFSFILTLLLPEKPLRQTIVAEEANIGGDMGRAFPMPTGTDSERQLLQGLAVFADRDVRRRYIESVVKRAGVDLSVAAAWLLVKIEENPSLKLDYLSRRHKVEISRLEGGINELIEKNLITQNHKFEVTKEGCDVLNRLVKARRENLEQVIAEWSPEQRAEIAASLHRVARELIPNVKEPV